MDGFTDIPGFEGLYAINEHGTIWSYPKTGTGKGSHSGKYLKPSITKKKYSETRGTYYRVNIRDKSGKLLSTSVHRLVALTFIPNSRNHKWVNHKDGNKSNNHVSNLEWCSPSSNTVHAFKTGLRKPYKHQHDSKCACFACHPERIRHAKMQ